MIEKKIDKFNYAKEKKSQNADWQNQHKQRPKTNDRLWNIYETPITDEWLDSQLCKNCKWIRKS